jgi:hypothetical protein
LPVTRFLRSRAAVIAVAIISLLAIWWVWAAVNPLPVVEDESSYLLQSRIFASGRWTAPSPPLPEFFQQAHVLTLPAVASKYPPGHALLMSIGALFGAPALVPLLLTAITGALLFALARRVSNEWVALLVWIIWLGDPDNLRFRAAYFSEVTTAALWLISWWALLEWRATRERRWLLALAAAIGWGAITRPLTMLAFAVPVGVIVLRDIARQRRWRDFTFAVALGLLVLSILPLWSARTTGDWRLTPQALYTRDYLPFDKPGFGLDSTPPALALSPVNRFSYVGFRAEHVKHTLANLPRAAFERMRAIAHNEWTGPRIVLVPFVLIGLFAMNAPVVVALACSLALFVGYLSYGHWAQWTLYSFEGLPILSMLGALGIWTALLRLRAQSATRIASVAVALLALVAVYELRAARASRVRSAAWSTSFQAMIDKLPMHSAVVFIHYAPRIGPHASVVTNSPRLSADSVWIVNDLGARNAELMKFTGARLPLAFYESDGRMEIDRTLLGPPASK